MIPYFILFCFCFSAPTDNAFSEHGTAVGPSQVHSKGALAPMNVFVCKLHGYIVYFTFRVESISFLIEEMMCIIKTL